MSASTLNQTSGGTGDRILDAAEALIQRLGYNGFSYNDIAKELEIRKASIHYYFASKAELGAAVMQRYRQRMETAMAQAQDAYAADVGDNAWKLLEMYISPYLQFAETPEKICLCGALSGGFPALPANMQREVNQFVHDHQKWLSELVEAGSRCGAFAQTGNATAMGRWIFSSLQGALLMKRATGDLDQLIDVTDTVKRILRA